MGNALAHPVDTATNLYKAGKDYVHNTTFEQKAEDVLRLTAGGLATAGLGKVAVGAGRVALASEAASKMAAATGKAAAATGKAAAATGKATLNTGKIAGQAIGNVVSKAAGKVSAGARQVLAKAADVPKAIRTTRQAGAKGGTATGFVTHRPIAELLMEANTPVNKTGISQAARAWDKHAGRPGGIFKPLSGTIAEKNAAASNWIKEVLTNPQTTMRKLRRGGFEYRLPNGQGVVFESNGRVNLLDPSWS